MFEQEMEENMSAQSPREVLLVGSFPVQGASKVFELVSEHLGSLVHQIPDGEQNGWILAAFGSHRDNPGLEKAGEVPVDADGLNPVPYYRLKPGTKADELRLGPYGIAENAKASYAEFKALRDQGRIAPGVRFQATMPGPGTTVTVIQMPAEDILPLAREALARELEQILEAIPADDLTIQLDVAMEAEHEEYLRRPDEFDAPIHEVFHWTLDQMADSVAWLADRVPADVELGFHICSAWHHDPDAGQDNAVLVDVANALAQRITRPIAYTHIPLIPDHDDAAMVPFKDLQLHPETKLFLGVIHLTVGLVGVERLMATAAKVVPDFGVAGFCGMGPAPANMMNKGFMYTPPPSLLKRVTARQIGAEATLDFHKAVAELEV